MKSFLSSYCDFQRLQNKTQKSAQSLPSLSSQSLSAEEKESLSSQPAAATEEPAEESPLPPTNQLLLPPQTSSTVLSVPELSNISVASTAHTVQEKTTLLPVQVFPTLSKGDTELTEVSTSVTVISTPQLVQTAISQPLSTGIPSVPPVQAAPTQTPQPEVNQLKRFLPPWVLFHVFSLYILIRSLTFRVKSPTTTVYKG